MASQRTTFSTNCLHTLFFEIHLVGSSNCSHVIWTLWRTLRLSSLTTSLMMQCLKSWETRSLSFFNIILKHSKIFGWDSDYTWWIVHTVISVMFSCQASSSEALIRGTIWIWMLQVKKTSIPWVHKQLKSLFMRTWYLAIVPRRQTLIGRD